jgi:putative transposase
LHAACEGLGYPLRFLLTGGQSNDITRGEPLVAGFHAEYTLADKGYDSDALVDILETAGSIAVIPPRRNRKVQRYFDRHIYRERHQIECLFNKLKQFRRIATRYDKTATSFLGFVHLAAALIWLR